jgi:GNAT superfamily N-acetyltransferase
VRIRTFSSIDYPAIVGIHNTIYPNFATTEEAWINHDRQRDPKYKSQRWVALEDERMVGYGLYSQQIFNYEPKKFTISIAVLPQYRRQGIGSALYSRIREGLLPFDPQKLRADGYGNLMEGVRFLLKRGFQEVFRETPLHLDVMTCDLTCYEGLEAKLHTKGIEITTLRDLEGEADRDRKVYDLFWQATQDVPHEGEITKMDFNEWAEWTLNDPLVPHDGYIIAVHEDAYVGISEFGLNPSDNSLQAGLVGVKKAFRKQGIALAMHRRAIAYAKKKGYALIKTSTAVGNVPMRSLYDRLGFIPQPDWIQFEKMVSADRLADRHPPPGSL